MEDKKMALPNTYLWTLDTRSDKSLIRETTEDGNVSSIMPLENGEFATFTTALDTGPDFLT